MPVTAKLSRKFYERLGDDIAGELVDWFNAVDSTYQSQLRETNDLNWERFKAELHAQASKLSADISRARADLMKWMFVYWTGTVIGLAVFVWTTQKP